MSNFALEEEREETRNEKTLANLWREQDEELEYLLSRIDMSERGKHKIRVIATRHQREALKQTLIEF